MCAPWRRRGRGVMVLLILIFCISWEMVRYTYRPFYLRVQSSIEKQAGWAPKPVWSCWRRDLVTLGSRTTTFETSSRCILHRLFCPDSRIRTSSWLKNRLLETCSGCILHRLHCSDSVIRTSSLLNKSFLNRYLEWRETRLHRKINRGEGGGGAWKV
jgi:Pyruvate/2-oxoacid:ferredoxin oxidoreductase delta subunit